MDANGVAELKRAERRLQAAQLASDVTALGELLHEDAVFTGPGGNLTTRHDGTRWRIIAAHASFLVDDPRSG